MIWSTSCHQSKRDFCLERGLLGVRLAFPTEEEMGLRSPVPKKWTQSVFSTLNAADPSHYFRFQFHGLLKGGNVSVHASICVCLHLLLHLWTMRTQDRPRWRPRFLKRVVLVQRHPVSRLRLQTRCAPPGVSTAGTCSREPRSTRAQRTASLDSCRADRQ